MKRLFDKVRTYGRGLILVMMIFSAGELQAAGLDSVRLSGKISPQMGNVDQAVFKIVASPPNAMVNWVTRNQTYTVKMDHGIFSVAIAPIAELFYVSFSITYSDGKVELLTLGNGTVMPFLLAAGDNIQMNFFSSTVVTFSGVGAEKLNCQKNLYLMSDFPEAVDNRLVDLKDQGDAEQEFILMESTLHRQLDLKLLLLKSYQHALDSAAYQRIYYDVIGHVYYSAYKTFYMADYGPLSVSDKALRWKVISRLVNKLVGYTVGINHKQAVLSEFYPQYLLLKERVEIKLNLPMDSVYRLDYPYLEELYTHLYSHYRGSLRDKLLLLMIVDMADNTPDVMKYLDQAIRVMGNSVSKQMLLDWKKSHAAGGKAFAFDLPDDHGARYRLGDFKGKVVIADFWFTGCHACPEMARAMEPIAAYYKDNKQVVFLSVNADREKKWWDYSLKEGIYSFNGAIHLSTYQGGGTLHPMLQYYNFVAFPQLLVIDRNGKVASAYPDDPRMDQGVGLKRLIDSLL